MIIWLLSIVLGLAVTVLALYMAAAYYHRAVIAWCDEREELFVSVFSAANVVLGRQHHYEWGRAFEGRFGHSIRGLAYNGVDINYETLAQMVMAEQDQRALLQVAMDHVALFELEHPLPPKPRLLEILHLI